MYEVEFTSLSLASMSQPGQFVNIRVNDQYDPLLRRPISIYDIDRQAGKMNLLYKVVGKGTGILSALDREDVIDVMGPLGNGFTLPEKPLRAVLVGGGVGIAPLVYLARVLQERQCPVQVLYGANCREQLAAVARLEELAIDYKLATVDGSIGYKGLVTELLPQPAQGQAAVAALYTCGPEPMMKAVTRYARENKIWGEVSLEAHMACGVGACLGCACKLDSRETGYAKVCKDGPVFAMTRWNLQEGQEDE
jgi:dihydroorotate dehydrogenase electron transfer subunit